MRKPLGSELYLPRSYDRDDIFNDEGDLRLRYLVSEVLHKLTTAVLYLQAFLPQ